MAKSSRQKQPSSSVGDEEKGHPAPPPVPSSEEGLFYRKGAHLLLIGILGLLAYSNTFHAPFQWDEAEYILRNPIIKNLVYFMEPSRVETLFDNALISRYVGYLTFALNYRLHGFDIAGYHIVNLAVHLINAILVYFLVALTFRTPYFNSEKLEVSSKKRETGSETAVGSPGSVHYSLFTIHSSRFFALAVALLFVSHPVQTEAVTYVFQRFASLVSMFYLLSLVLYIKGRLASSQAGKLASYFFALVCAVLAMKTKENAFTLPVVITLYEFLFFGGKLKKRLLRLLPFLLTMLIVPVTIIIMESGNTVEEIMSQIKDPESLGYQKASRVEYLFTQFRVIATYLRLLFLPINQNINYNYPVYRSFLDPAVLLSFVFLLALFGAAVYLLFRTQSAKRKAQSAENPMPYALCTLRLVAFGILWFFITLSVESSIIPIPMVINEYRVYLPSVGFFLAVVAGAVLLVNSIAMHRAKPAGQTEKDNEPIVSNTMRSALCALLIIVFSLASVTYARNTLWADKVSLWTDVVRKSPGSPRGYNNLGLAYSEKGLYEKAIAAYEYCTALYPSYRTAYVNLGVAYAVTGRINAAVAIFLKAVAMDPNNSIAYTNLGRAYLESGRSVEAVESYRKAIGLNPNNSSAFHGLGTAYVRLNLFDDALATYTRLIALSPNHPEAYRNRGIVYASKGDFNGAGADFRKACSLGDGQSCEFLKDRRFR